MKAYLILFLFFCVYFRVPEDAGVFPDGHFKSLFRIFWLKKQTSANFVAAFSRFAEYRISPHPPHPPSFSVGADVGQLGHWRFDLTPRPSQAVETRTTCVSILHGSLDRQVVKTEIEFRVEKMQRNPIIAPPRSRPMEVFAILAEIRTSQRPSIIMQLQIVLCKLTTEVIQLTMYSH